MIATIQILQSAVSHQRALKAAAPLIPQGAEGLLSLPGDQNLPRVNIPLNPQEEANQPKAENCLNLLSEASPPKAKICPNRQLTQKSNLQLLKIMYLKL